MSSRKFDIKWKKPVLTKNVPGNIKNILCMAYPALFNYKPLNTHVIRVVDSNIASHLNEGVTNIAIITRNHDIL